MPLARRPAGELSAVGLPSVTGRYSLNFPEPRQRDGWFRVGNLDVTTTALMVLKVDSTPGEQLVNNVRQKPGILRVKSVQLPKRDA